MAAPDTELAHPAGQKADNLQTVLSWLIIVLVILALVFAWHNAHHHAAAKSKTPVITPAQSQNNLPSHSSNAPTSTPDGATQPTTTGTGPGSTNSLLGPTGQ